MTVMHLPYPLPEGVLSWSWTTQRQEPPVTFPTPGHALIAAAVAGPHFPNGADTLHLTFTADRVELVAAGGGDGHPRWLAEMRAHPSACRECWGEGGDQVRGGPGRCARCGREGPGA